MSKNLWSSAVFAGLIAGSIAALLQFIFVIPLLLEGELYETGARVHFVVDGTTQSDRGFPGFGDELARHLQTFGWNIITYTGFGLIMCAAMGIARDRTGLQFSAKIGLIWGVCGFIAIQLAPGTGLPPELPGTPAAELAARQVWYLGTIAASVTGLSLIAFGKNGLLQIIGGGLILLPHLIGAPHLDTFFGVAPPELSAEFATHSLGLSAIGWSILGYFCGFFMNKGES